MISVSGAGCNGYFHPTPAGPGATPVIADTPTPFDLRFRFLGFPCNIGGLFWVGAILLGDGSFRAFGPFGLVAWIVALLISIFVHELGHALVARYFGSRVLSVKIHLMGGYCQYDRQPGLRWQRIAISLAGPCAGFLLWGLLRGIDEAFHLFDRAGNISPYLVLMLEYMLFVNLFWGFFNLLPILPLDGGHVCEELCEGSRTPNPNVTARWIGVGVAGGLAFCGLLLMTGAAPRALLEMLPWWLHPSPLMTVWMGLFAFQNYSEIQQLRAERGWGRGYGYADDDAPPWRTR
jgi:stage IV sporulation protein FB